ncbi:MAG: hypothetical protein ABSF29_00745 [Tepidisphaeraceae bacterium]|jgi:hypothetical protein
MYQCDPILKMYAENGLRTAEDWTSLGRDLTAGMKPRVDAIFRGANVSLFSRDQTHARPQSTRFLKTAQPTP